MAAWLIIAIAATVAIGLIVAIAVAVALRQIAFEVSELLEFEPTSLPRTDGSLDTSDGGRTAPATPEAAEAHRRSSPASERRPYHRMR